MNISMSSAKFIFITYILWLTTDHWPFHTLCDCMSAWFMTQIVGFTIATSQTSQPTYIRTYRTVTTIKNSNRTKARTKHVYVIEYTWHFGCDFLDKCCPNNEKHVRLVLHHYFVKLNARFQTSSTCQSSCVSSIIQLVGSVVSVLVWVERKKKIWIIRSTQPDKSI